MKVKPISDASVIIVAVSPHRREAIEAVAWAIDELKMKVPIWKKEFYDEDNNLVTSMQSVIEDQ